MTVSGTRSGVSKLEEYVVCDLSADVPDVPSASKPQVAVRLQIASDLLATTTFMRAFYQSFKLEVADLTRHSRETLPSDKEPALRDAIKKTTKQCLIRFIKQEEDLSNHLVKLDEMIASSNRVSPEELTEDEDFLIQNFLEALTTGREDLLVLSARSARILPLLCSMLRQVEA